MLVNVDTITDFVSGTDKITLSASVFAGLCAVESTIGLSDHLTYDSATGALVYDADGLGVNPGVTLPRWVASRILRHWFWTS